MTEMLYLNGYGREDEITWDELALWASEFTVDCYTGEVEVTHWLYERGTE